jgi:hypothetical protein
LAEIGLVGNGQITALVSASGGVPWCCWPRPDGDPIFCGLLNGSLERGVFDVEVVDAVGHQLCYQRNTAILGPSPAIGKGNAALVTTWCPTPPGRLYWPAMLIRCLATERPAVAYSAASGLRLRLAPLRAATRQPPPALLDGNQRARVTTRPSPICQNGLCA